MYQVDIILTAGRRDYRAELAFTDRQGNLHKRCAAGERAATENSNLLHGFIQSLLVLQRPCVLNIHTDSDYIISAFRNAWVREWKQNGWKTARQKDVRNKEQWQELDTLLAPHLFKFIKTEGKKE